MFEAVQIPYWLAIVAGALALVALLDRLLMPSARWYMRRRFNRAIEKLNDRLQLRIQPFKLTRRKVMIDRLLHDPKVVEAVTEHAEIEGVPLDVATELAKTYATEIVPWFSVFAYFGFAIRLSRWISQSLFRVRVGFMDDESLGKVDPNSTVVFIMNHRSNMDYVLVTYLASERSALSYAVGEWARVWPLQQVIKSMGGYFIRRKSRNLMYRRVLARYVQMATEGGVSQAIFPEGGLSLDGKPKEAKLGLLSYILDGFTTDAARDVVFIPVGLNYDRVLEDRVLTSVDPNGKRSFKFKGAVFASFVRKQVWLRMTKRFYRFGYACVSFGRPLSLKDFIREKDGAAISDIIEDLGAHLMEKVTEVIPVLPVPLVATVFCDARKPLSRLEVKVRCHALLEEFKTEGAYVHMPREDKDYAVENGLRTLELRHLIVEAEDGRFTLKPEEKPLVKY
ncbi:MAG: glycerol-3-phosphate O-acyltransferase, partial [Candidatus Paceibacteria bacterium]